MPVDERARRLLTDDLVRVHGEEVADILMAHLPPVGWADVATKQDLDNLALTLRAEIAGLPVSLRDEFATKQDLDQLRVEFKADLKEELLRQTRWVIGAFITCMFGTAGLVLGVLQLAR